MTSTSKQLIFRVLTEYKLSAHEMAFFLHLTDERGRPLPDDAPANLATEGAHGIAVLLMAAIQEFCKDYDVPIITVIDTFLKNERLKNEAPTIGQA